MKKQKKYKKESGQAMIIAVVFFICVSVATILGLTNPMVRHIAMATSIAISKESFYAAEAGVEDVVYRLKIGLPVASSQTLVVGDQSVITTITDESSGKVITAVGNANNYLRKVKTNLALGTGVAFHYGIQAGEGGFDLQNSSSVTGNVFSNGPIVGAGNNIYGDIVSAGPAGLVNNIHSTYSVFAHTISNSRIDKDAHYITINNTIVSGTQYPASPDQATSSLPISDEQIGEWESEAEAGGVINSPCPYIISSNTTLGPKKINCNVEISGSPTLTLTGPIWVVGNITTKNSPIIKVASSLGNKSVAIIADNSSNRLTSSKIDIQNSTTFQGSGMAGSFVFMISQNNSAESGGSEDAIKVANSAAGALVVYSNHGEIDIQNSVSLKEVTAYKITLKNSANVIYDTGLPNTLFSAGPGGGFDILKWKEVE